jgi:hypothetical protein
MTALPLPPQQIPGDINVTVATNDMGNTVTVVAIVPGGPTDTANRAAATALPSTPLDLTARIARAEAVIDVLVASLGLTPIQLQAVVAAEQAVVPKFAGASIAGWI